jgi:hypothetical protein
MVNYHMMSEETPQVTLTSNLRLPIIDFVAGQVTPRAETARGFVFGVRKTGQRPAIFSLNCTLVICHLDFPAGTGAPPAAGLTAPSVLDAPLVLCSPSARMGAL